MADAEARISRFQAAVAAGVDPAAMVEAINEAQAERAAARAELENTNDSETVTDAEIYAMIDSLGDVGAALSGAKHDRLAALYKAVDLQVRYEADENAAEIEIRPASRVNSVRVQGGPEHTFDGSVRQTCPSVANSGSIRASSTAPGT